MNENIVFIVGVGRSGTSLLQSMFAAHCDVNSLPECSFLRRFIIPGKLQAEFDKRGEKALQSVLRNDTLLARTGLDYLKILPPERDPSKNSDVDAYRNILSLCSEGDRDWVVEKDPKLIEYLAILRTLFPRSRIIHIIRDPRDVLVSKKTAKWSRSGHVWKHIFANRVQLALGRANGPLLFGPSYHEILYEELINSPASVLEPLCLDMGLPYDNNMLSFGAAAKKLVTESEYSWKKETLGPLLNDNKQKWKTKLTPREIRLTELCCGEAMVAGNYEFDDRNAKLSLLDKLWLVCGQLIISSAAYPYIIFNNRKVAAKCKNRV